MLQGGSRLPTACGESKDVMDHIRMYADKNITNVDLLPISRELEIFHFDSAPAREQSRTLSRRWLTCDVTLLPRRAAPARVANSAKLGAACQAAAYRPIAQPDGGG